MNSLLFPIPWLAVFLATFAHILIGAVWYHPKVFGQIWLEEMHFRSSDLKVTPYHWLGAFCIGFMLCVGVHGIININESLGSTTSLSLIIGAWAFFIAMPQFSSILWSKVSVKVWGINISCYLVQMLSSAVILRLV